MKNEIAARDYAQKLHDTICRYKGDPVYVTVSGTRISIAKVEEVLTKSELTVIDAGDKDFDISGIPLGYVQAKLPKTEGNHDKVYYLERKPVRRVKQGLSPGHLGIFNLGSIERLRYNPPADSYLWNKSFRDMVKGERKNVGDVIKELRGKLAKDSSYLGELVISRDIAMNINAMGVINIYYKNEHVGWMQPDKFIVHVPPNGRAWVVSKYLSDYLGWEID